MPSDTEVAAKCSYCLELAAGSCTICETLVCPDHAHSTDPRGHLFCSSLCAVTFVATS